MSKFDFMANFRRAYEMYRHRANRDSPSVANQRAASVLWLSPHSVDGFNPEDFAELSFEERERLTNAVDNFLHVSRPQSAQQSVPDELLQQGTTAFETIAEILRAYFLTDAETEHIRTQLLSIPLPDVVLSWEFEIGEDWTGDPALRIGVVVKDEAENDAEFFEDSQNIRELVWQQLRRAKIDLWPFVRFRTATDHTALLEGKV